ncbi:hypothetical protein BHE74_00034204 [Ensete ventricosum]|uniref:Uncharacterized protein n=1 Tax=Ensete ventricosum TaxID=4639 RepID=A0A426YRF0_ENSVE|nr:hypothetical protein B296_00032232 [Ensete ventricosum]RWW22977.1 hypothetical protein GW17_00012791 [Ensete ventricosum]RWW58898.1 hypothetical protein BHE74_00034204 [Ensete ventricosum]RZR77857.1 hypothetical protein BHM03_00003065 [Ensete ventricosum]
MLPCLGHSYRQPIKQHKLLLMTSLLLEKKKLVATHQAPNQNRQHRQVLNNLLLTRPSKILKDSPQRHFDRRIVLKQFLLPNLKVKKLQLGHLNKNNSMACQLVNKYLKVLSQPNKKTQKTSQLVNQNQTLLLFLDRVMLQNHKQILPVDQKRSQVLLSR